MKYNRLFEEATVFGAADYNVLSLGLKGLHEHPALAPSQQLQAYQMSKLFSVPGELDRMTPTVIDGDMLPIVSLAVQAVADRGDDSFAAGHAAIIMEDNPELFSADVLKISTVAVKSAMR